MALTSSAGIARIGTHSQQPPQRAGAHLATPPCGLATAVVTAVAATVAVAIIFMARAGLSINAVAVAADAALVDRLRHAPPGGPRRLRGVAWCRRSHQGAAA